MPLSKHRGGVTFILQHLRQSQTTIFDQTRATHSRKDPRAPCPKTHSAGQQAITSWRAHRSRTVRIGEAHSLLRQTIQIRSRDLRGRIVTPDIPIAQIIGEDEDDIRRGVRQGALNEQQGSSKAFENFHGLPLSCPLRGLALKFPLVAISASEPGLGMLRSCPLQSLPNPHSVPRQYQWPNNPPLLRSRLRQTPSGRTLSSSLRPQSNPQCCVRPEIQSDSLNTQGSRESLDEQNQQSTRSKSSRK